MIYAGLSNRAWGQEQPVAPDRDSSVPATRVLGLIRALSRRAADTKGSTAKAWAIVNQVSHDLWGRTANEEMAADLEQETKWVARIKQLNGVPDEAKRVVADYHRLRTECIALLDASPETFFSAAGCETMLRQLRPIPIVANPSGRLGVPPEGFEQVLGYKEERSKSAESRWWWAAVPSVLFR